MYLMPPYRLQKNEVFHHSMSLWMILILAPIQALIGDVHGLNTLKHQPAKIAAIEGHWENRIAISPEGAIKNVKRKKVLDS